MVEAEYRELVAVLQFYAFVWEQSPHLKDETKGMIVELRKNRLNTILTRQMKVKKLQISEQQTELEIQH